MKRASAVRAALAPLLNLLAFGSALFALDRMLREYHYRDIVRSAESLPWWAILSAVVLIAGSWRRITPL